jgi:hypothetical protein
MYIVWEQMRCRSEVVVESTETGMPQLLDSFPSLELCGSVDGRTVIDGCAVVCEGLEARPSLNSD